MTDEYNVSELLMMDEPLDPIPLESGTINILLVYAGEGEPIVQSDTLLPLIDDDL